MENESVPESLTDLSIPEPQISGWIYFMGYIRVFPVTFLIMLFSAILYLFVSIYSRFEGDYAYIHFGAMIGSLMVANVFFVIIPGQKEMVRCAKLGIPLDPSLGKKALARSLHNNYFTAFIKIKKKNIHEFLPFGNLNCLFYLNVIIIFFFLLF